jgi:hypothetical protein
MQVSTSGVVRRRRRNAQPAATLPAPALVTPTPAVPVPSRENTVTTATTYRSFPVANPFKGGGEYVIDWERAYADAQRTLDAIDFSKHDIVIWAPGTSNHGPHPDFQAAVEDSYRGEGSNLVALEYEATWKLRNSLPTGIATMQLVLEGIRKRGGDHRVLLAGESQGAWIIGEVLAGNRFTDVVDRAVLLGHPWLAAHQYTKGEDARVRVINHAGDQVAAVVKGNPADAIDAMIGIRTLDFSKLGSVVSALAHNPMQGVVMLMNIVYALPGLKSIVRNPHVYGPEMTRAVEYLRHGRLPFSAEFQQTMHLAPDPTLADPSHDDETHRRLLRGEAIAAYAAMRAA